MYIYIYIHMIDVCIIIYVYIYIRIHIYLIDEYDWICTVLFFSWTNFKAAVSKNRKGWSQDVTWGFGSPEALPQVWSGTPWHDNSFSASCHISGVPRAQWWMATSTGMPAMLWTRRTRFWQRLRRKSDGCILPTG